MLSQWYIALTVVQCAHSGTSLSQWYNTHSGTMLSQWYNTLTVVQHTQWYNALTEVQCSPSGTTLSGTNAHTVVQRSSWVRVGICGDTGLFMVFTGYSIFLLLFHDSGVRYSSVVRVHSWCNGSSVWSFMVDPLSYFLYQPVFLDWCNKGHGMCYPVKKVAPCSGGRGFPLLLSEWSFTICSMSYNCKYNVLSTLINKTFPSFLPFHDSY